jgi:hypothetical protein
MHALLTVSCSTTSRATCFTPPRVNSRRLPPPLPQKRKERRKVRIPSGNAGDPPVSLNAPQLGPVRTSFPFTMEQWPLTICLAELDDDEEDKARHHEAAHG